MHTWNINAGYTFEHFRVTEENLQVFQAAEAVALSPGKVHNPLFLYGPAGMGKTHLLHAIGNRILQEDPGTKIVYLRAGDFAKQWTGSPYGETVQIMESLLRSADVLLLDEIDALGGKMLAQEVLLELLETLQTKGKQIVMAAVRAPREQHGLLNRLQIRVSCGVVVPLQTEKMTVRAMISSDISNESLPEPDDLWQRVLSDIKPQIDADAFATWFMPARGKETEDGLEVAAPDEFSCDWLEFRYGTLISEAVDALSRKKLSVRFSVIEGEDSRWGAIDGSIGSYAKVRNELRSIRQLTEKLLSEQQKTNAMLERLCASSQPEIFSSKR